MPQVESEGGLGRQMFEVLAEVFAPAATALAAFDFMEKALEDAVGAFYDAYTAAEGLGHSDLMPEER